MRNTSKIETIAFLAEENFHLTSTFEIIEIAKKLNFTAKEKLQFAQLEIGFMDYKYYFDSVNFQLNVLIKIKKDLFFNQDKDFSINFRTITKKFGKYVIGGLVQCIPNPIHVHKMFENLKEKLGLNDYKELIKYLFSNALESNFYPAQESGIPEENAKIIHSILISTLSEDELKSYFFTNKFFKRYNGDIYEVMLNSKFIEHGVTLYCTLLQDSHLEMLMLNRSNGMSNLCFLMTFPYETIFHTLNELKKRISSDEKLLDLINKSLLL